MKLLRMSQVFCEQIRRKPYTEIREGEYMPNLCLTVGNLKQNHGLGFSLNQY
jgi:hypothetical protein